jgi:hypothetical protein
MPTSAAENTGQDVVNSGRFLDKAHPQYASKWPRNHPLIFSGFGRPACLAAARAAHYQVLSYPILPQRVSNPYCPRLPLRKVCIQASEYSRLGTLTKENRALG